MDYSDKIIKVNEARANGLDLNAACKSVGIAKSTYYTARKANGGSTKRLKRKAPYVESVALEAPTQNVALVIGSLQAIAELMKARGL